MDSYDIWNKYDKCKDYMQGKALKTRTEKCWKFYIGRQWDDPSYSKGVPDLPMMNFIKPTVKYKVSTIAQHTVTAVFSDMNEQFTETCDKLSKLFDISWEKSNMDRQAWKGLNNCAIAGDSYMLFYDGDTRKKPQILLNTQVYLGDENNPNIQEQPYIIVEERLSLDVAKDRAKKYGCTQEQIENIQPDGDTTEQLYNREEVSDKVTSLLYFEKKDGEVYIARTTKTVMYEELHKITRMQNGQDYGKALALYPILSMIWEETPNCARGVSEVEQMIPNQIEVNRTLARRAAAIKLASYPRLAYDGSMIDNPEDIENVGAAIKMNGGNTQNINGMITYLSPMSQSGDAKMLSDELMKNTKDLAGASDTAMGNIDLSRVSGTAVTSIRDQQQVPLNEQVAMYKEFVENVAMLYFELWRIYFPQGVEFDGIKVDAEDLNGILPNVRIDISENNTWSKVAEQQEVSNLFNNGKLTFEEYAKLMPDHTSIPRDKLLQVVAERKAQQELQAQQQAQMAAQMQAQQNGQIDNTVQSDVPDQTVSDGGTPQDVQAQLAQQ